MKNNLLTLATILLIVVSSSTTYVSALPTDHTAWNTFHKFSGCRSGHKIDGLSELKHYFQHFGYLEKTDNVSPQSNFTDDFDHALERAVKAYQRNFNLDQTGELDDVTLNQIKRPRCGNADAINGFNTMKRSGKSISHYSLFPGTPRWPENRRNLTYAFLARNQLSDAAKSVFARAFAKWSAVIPLTFTQTASYTTADIRIAFYVGDHGDRAAFDGALGTLAHTFEPMDGRMHFDNDESWVVEGDVSKSPLPNAMDLESIAVHEIGHALGLRHSSIKGAVMYPTISPHEKKVELEPDDVEGVQYLCGGSGSGPTTLIQNTNGVVGFAPSLWRLISLIVIIPLLFFLV